MSDLQKKIDNDNKQAKKDKARAERREKVEAVRDYINSKVNKVKSKVDGVKSKAADKAENRRLKKAFLEYSEATYQAYMDEASHMTEVETREMVSEGMEKHTVQTENGPIMYIEDKSWDANRFPHREYKVSYSGFTEIANEGLKQKVFVSFTEEGEKGYSYGYQDDFYSAPRKSMYGFMRDTNGSYKRIHVNLLSNKNEVEKDYISFKMAREIYSGLTTAYKARVAELHPESENDIKGV